MDLVVSHMRVGDIARNVAIPELRRSFVVPLRKAMKGEVNEKLPNTTVIKICYSVSVYISISYAKPKNVYRGTRQIVRISLSPKVPHSDYHVSVFPDIRYTNRRPSSHSIPYTYETSSAQPHSTAQS